jgi:hypothetical protein
MEDDGVLAALEDDFEVAADNGIFCPPPIDDAPFLSHE